MTIRSLFATRFYEDLLGDAALVEELGEACLDLAQEDRAGRAWSKAHGYRGYTSYASLADLPSDLPMLKTIVQDPMRRHHSKAAHEALRRGKALARMLQPRPQSHGNARRQFIRALPLLPQQIERPPESAPRR